MLASCPVSTVNQNTPDSGIHSDSAQSHPALGPIRTTLPDAFPLAYGHVGDGNVHLNVIPAEGMANSPIDALFAALASAMKAAISRPPNI
jgi:FAD/FMN-containing dehydrogenase